jgi:hypothetical protein
MSINWGYNIYTRKYHKETPCEATFISNKLNCHVFHVCLFSFLFYKIGEQESRTSPVQWGDLAPVGESDAWMTLAGISGAQGS